jgi:hypothetical protein
MSDREKKLLLLLGLAAFVIVNVFGFSRFRQARERLATRLIEAEGSVQMADAYAAKYETVTAEMEWMDQHKPQPRAGQLVATELEQYASNQATTHQLDVKRRAIKPIDETGTNFHRAKVEFNVTGKEDLLYRWLDRLQMPDQLRAITFLRLKPDKDDTLIDCVVEVEQWFVPQSEDEASAAPVEGATPALVPPAPPVPPVPTAAAPGATPSPVAKP